jgi:hypothetical protein
MMNNKQTQIEWLQNETKKDIVELEKEKMDFISHIKNYKKEELLPKPKKITIWQRIKTVLKIS